MDNLTHGLIGYCLYRMTAPDPSADRQVEKGLLYAALAASELPDLDMVSAFFGSATNMAWHRTYTHSLPGILLLGGLVAFVAGRIWPGLPRGRLFGLAMAGGGVHVFFDLLTSYGTKALLPWQNIPYAWDVLPIVDPYLLVMLGLFAWCGYVNRPRAVLWLLVGAMVLYIGGRGLVHENLVSQVRGQYPAVERVGLMPPTVSLTDWRFIAQLPEGYQTGSVRLGQGVYPAAFYPLLLDDPVAVAAAQTYTGQVFLGFARFPACKLEWQDDLWHLTYFDPRWVSSGRSLFSGQVWLDGSLRVVREEMRH